MTSFVYVVSRVHVSVNSGIIEIIVIHIIYHFLLSDRLYFVVVFNTNNFIQFVTSAEIIFIAFSLTKSKKLKI